MNIDYAPKLNIPDFDQWTEQLVDTFRVGEFEMETINVTNYATINQYRLGQVGSWDITENTIQNGTIVIDNAQNRITVDTIVLDGAQNEIRIGGTEVKLDADAQVISINSATFGNQGIQLDYNSGTPRSYTGDGSNQYFKFDGTNVSWKGTNTELTAAGAFTATNATITGSITASTGTIGGWSIGATSLSSGTTHIILDSSNKKISINNATYGNAGIQLDYNSGTPRVYVGDGSNQYLKFDGTNISWKGTNTELTAAGAFTASNATITGSVTASSGTIGGWTIAATTLSSSNITLDDGNDKITVNTITIDGANDRIRSGNYVTGYAGAGFTLEPDLFEVGNASIRGILRAAVFQKDVISVVGGNVIVRPGDVLATDMTAADASTLTVEGNESFAVGDFLRIKDGGDDEWLEVTNIGSAPTYTVTRDKNSQYASGSNPAWKKGASVINYGASGEGGIMMTSSLANAPYISIFNHAGSPWDTIATKIRLGNLNGFLGYSSDLYGIAIGEAEKYLKYESTNGLQVKGEITATGLEITGTATVRSLIQIETTGSIRSTTSGNYPYLEFSNSGLQLKDDDTGGTYGTATYTTAAQYGFGATVWLMNSHYYIPWMEVKEPVNSGGDDMPSLRLYDRSADPAGGSYEQGDICVVNGDLKIYNSVGGWTVVGTQS